MYLVHAVHFVLMMQMSRMQTRPVDKCANSMQSSLAQVSMLKITELLSELMADRSHKQLAPQRDPEVTT